MVVSNTLEFLEKKIYQVLFNIEAKEFIFEDTYHVHYT